VAAVLNVESRRTNAFNADDLAFYTAVAGQLGVALENARLYQAEQRRRREAETLYRAAQALTTTLDLPEVFDRILTELQQTVAYDSASVQLLEDGVLRIIGGRGFPNPEEILGLTFDPGKDDNPNGRVVRSRAPVILEDAPLAYAEFHRQPHKATNIRAWLGVPLLFGDRVIGILALDKGTPGFYTAEHARVALTFAGQAAIAIENAQLYQQIEDQSGRLKEAIRELQELDRLRNQLVQNVSHELRTPLTLIQGYAELLINEDLGPLAAAQCNAIEMIHERAVILARLIYNLTALQAIPREALALVPLSLTEVIRQVLNDYRQLAARSDVRFDLDMAQDLPLIRADRERLALAFLHLIDNAIKFSPDGGTVWIRAWSEKGVVCLSVRDEGIGIAPEHIGRVFERFYQADGSTTRRFGGMGVGLALVWEIVEAHGGEVDVTSEVGRGSIFTVRLPEQGEG
jgi:signal transduction histidine kinase